MSAVPQNYRVLMAHTDLAAAPRHPLPAGFVIRNWQPGDISAWLGIHALADQLITATADGYRQAFGSDEDQLAARQLFLCREDGATIGTASAWHDSEFRGEDWGRVHWVAIVPAYQGRGLSRPLLSAVCDRLVALGHERCYLATSSARLPALRLYLSFGFQPEVRDDTDRAVWASILASAADARG